MYYDARGLPSRIDLLLDGSTTVRVVGSMSYTRDRLPVQTQLIHAKAGIDNTNITFAYDTRRRLIRTSQTREGDSSASAGDINRVGLNTYISYVVHQYDEADNLTAMIDQVNPAEFPTGHKPRRTLITHDGLYRVGKALVTYRPDTSSPFGTDTASDWRDNQDVHRPSDPMRENPADMLPTQPSNRVAQLLYDYDWLANMVKFTDDQSNFYERSIGTITNGFTEGERPSALYLSTNLPTTSPSYSASTDRGGWVEVDYGVSGNVVAMTVHARCFDTSMTDTCWDDTSGDLDERRAHMRAHCTCAGEQHYQYRYDEVNRITEARRYERAGSGDWDLEVRQRYRYDGGNERIIKQTLDENPDMGDPSERVHLYVYPGDFDRSGMVRDGVNDDYDVDTTLGSETQYLIGGARIVWKNAPPSPIELTENVRITYAIGDNLGTTSAVVDVYSGDLLDMRTYYPTGAQETLRVQDDVLIQPEPAGFTTKEADDEVGITYFGHRYLFQHLGRWTTPDPLHVHAVGGGEALNSYHYVSGNLLQARDHVGLDYNAFITRRPDKFDIRVSATVDLRVAQRDGETVEAYTDRVENTRVEFQRQIDETFNRLDETVSTDRGYARVTFEITVTVNDPQALAGPTVLQREGLDTNTNIAVLLDANPALYPSTFLNESKPATTPSTRDDRAGIGRLVVFPNQGSFLACGAHEVGHFLGLDERYTAGQDQNGARIPIADPSFEGNVMGDAQSGGTLSLGQVQAIAERALDAASATRASGTPEGDLGPMTQGVRASVQTRAPAYAPANASGGGPTSNFNPSQGEPSQ